VLIGVSVRLARYYGRLHVYWSQPLPHFLHRFNVASRQLEPMAQTSRHWPLSTPRPCRLLVTSLHRQHSSLFISSSRCRRISSSCLITRHSNFLVTDPLVFGPSSLIVALLCYRLVSRRPQMLQLSNSALLPNPSLEDYKRSLLSTDPHHI